MVDGALGRLDLGRQTVEGREDIAVQARSCTNGTVKVNMSAARAPWVQTPSEPRGFGRLVEVRLLVVLGRGL